MRKLWINSLKNKTFTSGKSVMASRWCQLFFFSCPVCQFLSLYLDIYSWVGSLYLQSSVLDSIICLLLDRRIRLSAQWARGNKLRAEERQSDPEREARLLCPVSTLWWWGQRGARNKKEAGGSDSPECTRSPVISSHPPAKKQIYTVQAETHSMHASGKLSTCNSLCSGVPWVNTPLL